LKNKFSAPPDNVKEGEKKPLELPIYQAPGWSVPYFVCLTEWFRGQTIHGAIATWYSPVS